MGEAFAQLASISAVLGGFTVTFLAVVLTYTDDRRRVGMALGLATAAAACFFVSALGWSLFAFRLTMAAARGQAPVQVYAEINSSNLHQLLSIAFVLGTALLFVTLGVGGWLRSRRLGIVTSTLAFLASVAVWAILGSFLDVRIGRG